MRMLKLPFLALLLLVGMGLASPAQAKLVARLDGQAVFDTDLNITWLANANANGWMSWDQANTWAAGLNVGGFTGWRLPTALNADGSGPDEEWWVSGSELGHLYYTEGGLTPYQNITRSAYLSSFFSNMQNDIYWSGTEYAPYPLLTLAWAFDTSVGAQGYTIKGSANYAWAVHDGDVGGPAPAVPEPEQYMMMLVGGCAIWLHIRARQRG